MTSDPNPPAPLPDTDTAAALLAAGATMAQGPVSLACSFSIEDVVLIDLIQSRALPIGIFALDTGRLPEETYETAEAVQERYGVRISWVFPEREVVERLEREKGLFSFRASLDNRRECCRIRKVEPLARALAGLAGWVTGQRRGQSVTRAELAPLEIDESHGGMVKLNPLADWTEEQVWAYARAKRIPLHPLHQRGYPSIGCAPCTRAVAPGEDPRAGRWWWENPEHKECGLHSPRDPQSTQSRPE